MILVVLAAAWVAREATHRGAPAARPAIVGTGGGQPASLTIGPSTEPQGAGR